MLRPNVILGSSKFYFTKKVSAVMLGKRKNMTADTFFENLFLEEPKFKTPINTGFA